MENPLAQAKGIGRDRQHRWIGHADHGQIALHAGQHRLPPQGTLGNDNSPQLRRVNVTALPIAAHQIRCPTEPHQHAG